MKKLIYTTLAILSVSAILIGCKSSKDLEVGGVYNQDAFLYNSDASVNASFTTIDTFLTWEVKNNEYVKSNFPSVFNAANILRDSVPVTLTNIATARALYVSYSSSTNHSADQAIIASNTLNFAISSLQTYSKFALNSSITNK